MSRKSPRASGSISPAASEMGVLAPGNSPAQRKAASKKYPPVPSHCFVTGGTGFVGQRLVEMLVERGAKQVVSFDIVPPPSDAWKDPRIKYVVGDVSDAAAVEAACQGATCVWHIAAAVGPFHPKELYERVNHLGTVNVINACKKLGIHKLVMSSSPSTRFTGENVDGLTEEQLPPLPLKSYLQEYAASKARGEMAVTAACCDDLLTVNIAPHQVYGPRDNLFMPNMLEAAGSGLLHIFASPSTGYGKNRICFTHVDNYCHGLIIGERALYKDSPALGKFYIVTDGNTHSCKEGYVHFWEVMEEAVVHMDFPSIMDKFKLPTYLLYPIAYACNGIGWLLGKKLKLNPFNVTVLTMHRWFRIDAAVRDLQFEPIIPFREGWDDAKMWFKQSWLPGYKAKKEAGVIGIASQSQRKIDIQGGDEKQA